jgi:proteasome lid subunit RPN8/RPN11
VKHLESALLWCLAVVRRTLETVVQKLAGCFGYEIRKISQSRTEKQGFALYNYLKEDGSFDYDRYHKTQTAGNNSKIANVWVIEENVAFLSNYIKTGLGPPLFGICHGTRRGKEQQWFKKYLGCEVIGTEISDTAGLFPDTIQWDFHETKPEWIDAVDFIYSNSFDHSYDPEKCLNAWMSCVRKGGVCILEHSSSGHGPCHASALDPFGADLVQMSYLITLWGKGRYGVRELVETPRKNEDVAFLHFIVIQRF